MLASAGVIAAVVVSTILALGSSLPLDAIILATVELSPSHVDAVSSTVDYTAYEVVRAPQGYTITTFRTEGSTDPQMNAFQYTSTLTGSSHLDGGGVAGLSQGSGGAIFHSASSTTTPAGPSRKTNRRS